MKGPISNHFSWTEALYLPQWGRQADELDGLSPEIKDNLIVLFTKMDIIRDHFGKPIKVHVAYRPSDYNKLVKGAKHSAHLVGKACDFHVSSLSCDDVRTDILNNKLLEQLNMRMEDLPGSSWVHLDFAPVQAARFFKP